MPLGRLRELRNTPGVRRCDVPGRARPRPEARALPAVCGDTHVRPGAGGLMKLQARLMRHEVIPFALYMGLLVLLTLLADAALHLLDIVWIGRYLGIPGTLLIIAS